MQSADQDDVKHHSDIPDLYSDEEEKRPITWDRNNAPCSTRRCSQTLRPRARRHAG